MTRETFNARAAASTWGIARAWNVSSGFQRNATLVSAGRSSLRSCSCFAVRSNARDVEPVMFPPGFAKLTTSPLPTGSPTIVITMGIELVASLAALVATPPYPRGNLGLLGRCETHPTEAQGYHLGIRWI